jgi:hypothetical protein
MLTVRQMMVLDVAETRFASYAPGRKDEHIYDLVGYRPTRYYQVLNHLLDDPAALAYAPATVRRLQRLRDRRQRARSTRRLGAAV